MNAPLLEVSSLSKAFDAVQAVRAVSLSVAAGEIVAVIGPNGAGKTTLFNLVHGEMAADSGEVRLDGRSLRGLPTHAIARLGVSRTFQVPATFASMSVAESIALVLAAHEARDAAVVSPMLVLHARCRDLLARLRIADLAGAHSGALAYGDAKRVELALALATTPRLLLLDEPTAGMSPRSRRELMQLVVDLARDGDVALLFTEHDMDIVFGFAQRVVVLDRGAVLAEGTPEQIRGNPDVQAAYLG